MKNLYWIDSYNRPFGNWTRIFSFPVDVLIPEGFVVDGTMPRDHNALKEAMQTKPLVPGIAYTLCEDGAYDYPFIKPLTYGWLKRPDLHDYRTGIFLVNPKTPEEIFKMMVDFKVTGHHGDREWNRGITKLPDSWKYTEPKEENNPIRGNIDKLTLILR